MLLSHLLQLQPLPDAPVPAAPAPLPGTAGLCKHPHTPGAAPHPTHLIPPLCVQRYRICEEHAAAKELLIEGATQRFCQQ